MLVAELGVPPADVAEESQSFDTVGNAFFTRLLFCDLLRLEQVSIQRTGCGCQRPNPAAGGFASHFESSSHCAGIGR